MANLEVWHVLTSIGGGALIPFWEVIIRIMKYINSSKEKKLQMLKEEEERIKKERMEEKAREFQMMGQILKETLKNSETTTSEPTAPRAE